MRASRQTRRALPMRDTWPQQGRPIVSVSTILKSRSIIYAARFLSRARFPARSTLRHTSSLDDLRTLVDDKPLPPPHCPCTEPCFKRCRDWCASWFFCFRFIIAYSCNGTLKILILRPCTTLSYKILCVSCNRIARSRACINRFLLN